VKSLVLLVVLITGFISASDAAAQCANCGCGCSRQPVAVSVPGATIRIPNGSRGRTVVVYRGLFGRRCVVVQ